jgi:catechol 2,3-dioxygenase-like lactoylglutathione lyase family enzyme
MSTPPRWNVAPYFLVQDVRATAEYYRDRLGFQFERFWGAGPSFTMVWRRGVTIMLGRLEGGPGMPNAKVADDVGVWDAYVWVDDADALYAEYKAAGVRIARDICDQPYNCRDFDVEDPNGYIVCFGQDLAR